MRELIGRSHCGNAARARLAVAITALLASLVLAQAATPVGASPAGPGVRDGKNISVFHESDFVAAFGYRLREELTVDVYRGPHKIASASGPAVETPEGPGLEVNHGPEGAAVRGDCWEGVTPDILPGDRIVVTGDGGTDEVFVDDIVITSGPTDDTSTADDSDVILEGRASFINEDGTRTPIPVGQLSDELRQGSTYRASPNAIERIPDTADGWRATFRTPYASERNRDGLDNAQQKLAILNGDHALGYGHVEPLPHETQIVELPALSGPALDCGRPSSPFYAPKSANAVATADDRSVNRVSGDLVVGGTAAQEISAVSITLSDGVAATTDPTANATGPTASPGDWGWSAEFSRAQLEGLRDGTLTARGTFELADGTTTTGVVKRISKDTVAPGRSTATPEAGLYYTTQRVRLIAPNDEARIRYTEDGSNPTATTGQAYDGPFQVPDSRTIRARAFDAAGNPGPVVSFEYTIDLVAPTITATPAGGLFKKAPSVRLSSDDPRARIFYTVGGQPPTRSSPEFKRTSRPIVVDRTATIRALAADPADNETRRAFEYRIDTKDPTVSASLKQGSYDPTPPRVVNLSASEAGNVYFTTDGSAPDTGSPNTTEGTGPIQLDRTKTVKAMAVDRAGNRGTVTSFRYVIREPTQVTLEVPTTDLTLGRSREISGSVSPVGAGETVEMTIFTPGTSPNVTKTLALNGASRFAFTYKPKSLGMHSASVSFAKDADNLGSTSQLQSFRVVR